jgi:hypothetical protein
MKTPIFVVETIMPSANMAANKAYSTALTPDLSLAKRVKKLFINTLRDTMPMEPAEQNGIPDISSSLSDLNPHSVYSLAMV